MRRSVFPRISSLFEISDLRFAISSTRTRSPSITSGSTWHSSADRLPVEPPGELRGHDHAVRRRETAGVAIAEVVQGEEHGDAQLLDQSAAAPAETGSPP